MKRKRSIRVWEFEQLTFCLAKFTMITYPPFTIHIHHLYQCDNNQNKNKIILYTEVVIWLWTIISPIRKLRKKIISWNPNNPWFIQYFRFVGGPSKLKSITTHFQTIQRNANQPHVGDLDVQQLTLLFARATVNTVLLYIYQGCWHWQRHFLTFSDEKTKKQTSHMSEILMFSSLPCYLLGLL